MLWRLLLLISLVPIAVGLVLRWWLGTRVLLARGGHLVNPNSAVWKTLTASSDIPDTAAAAGELLREASFRDWQEREPAAARARVSVRRFGMAVPPLAIAVAMLGLIAVRIPFAGVLAVIFAATGIATAMSLLSLAAELRAVAHAAARLRESRAFRRADDENAVIDCAAAQVWAHSLPPLLRFLP